MIITLLPGDAPLRIQLGNDDSWIAVELDSDCNLNIEGRFTRLSTGEYVFSQTVSNVVSSDQSSD